MNTHDWTARLTEKKANLGEVGALGPNAAVMAKDGGGGEVGAVDVGHQVVVYVRLPRHRFVSGGEREEEKSNQCGGE